MAMLKCRLLTYAVADGPRNMATDEVLLHSAAAGVASLRFYGWSPVTLSLGYFQSEKVRQTGPYLAALPFVRRPSGGDTLVHHFELTYALALPAGPPWQTCRDSWFQRMHGVIKAGLAQAGVDARVYKSAPPRNLEGPLCFHHFTAGDLLLEDAKIVGSAQRKHRKALLQHGAILLSRSPHTPSLPGIRELTGRELAVAELCKLIRQEFELHTEWQLESEPLGEAEQQGILDLMARRYTQDFWNRRR